MNIQSPLNTPYGPRTSTDELLDGVDFTGRNVVVTGGYSGLGLATSAALHRRGANLIVPARRPDAAREQLEAEGLDGVRVVPMDLADLESVANAGRELQDVGPIHLLMNVAAVMACPLQRVEPQGWEYQFATNHLGHFALVQHLWSQLVDGRARIVAYSSGAVYHSDIRWDDVDFVTGEYDPWKAYGQSKTGNALHAVELARRGAEHGILAYSLSPGSILTPLQRHLSKEEMMDKGWIDEEGKGINPDFKTPDQGASTGIWCATAEELIDRSGAYCVDCDIIAVSESQPGVPPYAVDPEGARRLWDLSVERTELDVIPG